MITCNECKFIIKFEMKFSIKKNECPCCGNVLLKNDELKKAKMVSQDLLNAGFNKNLFELSIFICNNYFNKEPVESISQDTFDPSNEKSEIKDLNLSETEEQEIDTEYLEEDRDFDRVERLRELARENPILNKKGVSVRRVTIND